MSQKDEAIIVVKQVKEVEAEVLSMKELKDAVEKSSDQESLSAKKQVIDNMNTQHLYKQFVSTKQPLPP